MTQFYKLAMLPPTPMPGAPFHRALAMSGHRGEQDRFLWYCPACDAPLHQAVRQVGDWRDDPVSEVYAEFYGAEAHRTCGKCGHVTPRPEARGQD